MFICDECVAVTFMCRTNEPQKSGDVNLHLMYAVSQFHEYSHIRHTCVSYM